jgi:hypothetical protein
LLTNQYQYKNEQASSSFPLRREWLAVAEQKLRGAVDLVGRAQTHACRCPRAHHGQQLAVVGVPVTQMAVASGSSSSSSSLRSSSRASASQREHREGLGIYGLENRPPIENLALTPPIRSTTRLCRTSYGGLTSHSPIITLSNAHEKTRM